MLEAKIIDRGRGPEIAGTRITVYDVLDYHKTGWHRDMIADTLELSSQQVEVDNLTFMNEKNRSKTVTHPDIR
jgi:uncharacterized protein (DUF433 family)